MWPGSSSNHFRSRNPNNVIRLDLVKWKKCFENCKYLVLRKLKYFVDIAFILYFRYKLIVNLPIILKLSSIKPNKRFGKTTCLLLQYMNPTWWWLSDCVELSSSLCFIVFFIIFNQNIMRTVLWIFLKVCTLMQASITTFLWW